MQKIYAMILGMLLFETSATASAAQESMNDVLMPPEGVAACLATLVRLDRLACYDRVFGFDNTSSSETDSLNSSPRSKPATVQDLDREIRETLSASGRLPDTDIPAQLVLRDEGTELPAENLAALEHPDDAFEALRDVADLRMALRADTHSSVRGVLSLRCTRDITEFDILWSEPFHENIDVVWLYYNDNMSEAEATPLPVTFRPDTRIFQFPRGLQSIRLLQGIAGKNNSRILFEAGKDRRLIAFDARKLSRLIRAQARYCSWK